MASEILFLLLPLSSGFLAPAPKPSLPWRVSRGSADSSLPAWPQAAASKKGSHLQFDVGIRGPGLFWGLEFSGSAFQG